MKDTRKIKAQGELLFIPIARKPSEGLKRVESVGVAVSLLRSIDNRTEDRNKLVVDCESGLSPRQRGYIVGHSETGHNHVVLDGPGIEYWDTDKASVSVLDVAPGTETEVIHIKEGPDKHVGFPLESGPWEIRRQRERTPEGFQPVKD